jgi:hypothetical protein
MGGTECKDSGAEKEIEEQKEGEELKDAEKTEG